MDPRPVTLEGRRVRLEPLDLSRHLEGLLGVGLEPELWRWTLDQCLARGDLERYLGEAMAEQAAGRALPFATMDLASRTIAGCTRFANIDRRNRRMEIGWTWVGKPFQRTHVNTEAKYLMFRHAFEDLGCVRVELKTNVLNQRSRDAMKRLGCVEEGVFRKHGVNSFGVWRDTVYYSVLDTEWPGVKTRIEGMLAR